MRSRLVTPRSHMKSGMIERIKSQIVMPQGVLRAEVWEDGRLVEVQETKNTIVNYGVAAMALRLLPAGVKIKADDNANTDPTLDADANHYEGSPLAINHWRMGAHATTAATAPTVDDTDLENNSGSLTTGNGSGPWYTALDGSNITVKSLSGTDLENISDIDETAGFEVSITMEEGEANDLDNSNDQIRKVYREAALFFYYPDPSPSGYPSGAPTEPFSGANSKAQSERLFARALLDTLVKTPTRQITLVWRFSFPSS